MHRPSQRDSRSRCDAPAVRGFGSRVPPATELFGTNFGSRGWHTARPRTPACPLGAPIARGTHVHVQPILLVLGVRTSRWVAPCSHRASKYSCSRSASSNYPVPRGKTAAHGTRPPPATVATVVFVAAAGANAARASTHALKVLSGVKTVILAQSASTALTSGTTTQAADLVHLASTTRPRAWEGAAITTHATAPCVASHASAHRRL
jgi:hypothetical protein